MSDLRIERIGGYAGFGAGRLKSIGQLSSSDLSDEDRSAVDALFAGPAAASGRPDMFRYKITRDTPEGAETVEVPEHAVPSALAAAVKDELL